MGGSATPRADSRTAQHCTFANACWYALLSVDPADASAVAAAVSDWAEVMLSAICCTWVLNAAFAA
jgi:hypothetical protein